MSGNTNVANHVESIYKETKLTASDKATTDRFGWSVSVNSDGTTVVVGAHAADPSGVSTAGTVYMHKTKSIEIPAIQTKTEVTVTLTEYNSNHIKQACTELGLSETDYINHCINHHAEFHYKEVIEMKKLLKNQTTTHSKE